LVNLSFLATYLRTSKHGGSYVEKETLEEEAEAYDEALSAASTAARLGFSGGSDVRAHLLRKHLIRVDYQSDELRNKAKGLSHKELKDLKLPDEMGYLETVPYIIRRRYIFGQTFNCYPLFISCFACLARAPLRQYPEALAYAENAENRPKIIETLDAYRTRHGYNPSLERLFQILMENNKDRTSSLDSSSSSSLAEVAKEEAQEPPKSSREGRKQTNKGKKTPVQPAASKQRGRGRPCKPVAANSDLPSSERAAPSKGRAGRQKAPLSSSSSRPVATTGTAQPAFRHTLASREPMEIDLDLEEEAEDAD
jgi:hypothetical protein